tara:strand:- start:281 stop:505 length:225 start_codon:yes stop_codon:yes gene_type:complete
MSDVVMATPAGQPQVNKDNDLCRKLGTLARTEAHIRQCVAPKSSNFLTIFLEFIAVLAIMLGSIIAAWCLAVIV